jgi:hypothetical protein
VITECELHKCLLIGAIIYLAAATALGDDLSVTEKELNLDVMTISFKPNNLSNLEDPRIPFLEINDSIHVTARVPWFVIAEDVDPATRGHFTEWNGTSYCSRRLFYPLNVSASREVTLPKGGIILNGTDTTASGNMFNVTFRQRTSWDDEPLQEGSMYRTIVTLRGTPVI